MTCRSCQATRIASTSGKYYSVARPIPAASAIRDIVTACRPCWATSAVALRIERGANLVLPPARIARLRGAAFRRPPAHEPYGDL